MSEAEQLPDEQVEDQIEDRHEEQEEAPQLSADQEQAQRNGHVSRDQWIEQGKDADDWVSAKKFNERGDMIGKIRKLERDSKDRDNRYSAELEQIKKFTQAAIQQKERELDEAVDMADRDKARAIRKEIKDLEAPTQAQQPEATDHTLEEWNADNPWIMDSNDPKAAYAHARYNAYSGQGMSTQEAINKMEADVNKAFSKQQRSAPTPERGVSTAGKRREQKMTINDVPDNFKRIGHGMFKDDEALVKAYIASTQGN